MATRRRVRGATSSEEGSACFNGIEMAIFGLDTKKSMELKKLITTHGGTVRYVPSPKTQYVITTAAYFTANKTRFKTDKPYAIVTTNFIEDSVAAKAIVDDSSYRLVQEEKPAEEESKENAETKKSSNPYAISYDDMLAAEAREDGEKAKQAAAEKEAEERRKIAKGKEKEKAEAQKDVKWRSARVFISSTFRDMHGERDYLTRYVFPELQDRCNKLHVHVTPVDLRWGVTEEDTQQALEICLTEIDNCRPFFLGLLGKRYGWIPEAYIVPDEPKFDWVRTFPLGRSITHMEMHYGVLRNPSKARACFYFRDPSFEQGMPPEQLGNFQCESYEAMDLMEKLRDEIREKVDKRFIYENYPCVWKGVVDGKPMVGGLEEFGRKVLDDLWESIKAEFPEEDSAASDPLARARSYHETFIETHARQFVGRSAILKQLHSFVEKDANSKPCVVIGEPGGGKSSLVAAFAREFLNNKENKNTNQRGGGGGGGVVHDTICHFVGAAPMSTNIRHTLDRLCKELRVIINKYDVADTLKAAAEAAAAAAAEEKAKEEEKEKENKGKGKGKGKGKAKPVAAKPAVVVEPAAPAKSEEDNEDDEDVEEGEGMEDYKSLKDNFAKYLERAGLAVSMQEGGKKRLVLIIDALNQLDETFSAHNLDWLPKEMPKGVRLIVSTLKGTCLDALRRRPHDEVLVGPLDMEERKEIVNKTLWEYRKKLDKKQMAKLLAKTDATKPLYLIVACEELRVFGVYEKVSERIDNMAPTVADLFAEVLKRLENDHGEDIVKAALSLLECSRGGLLEVEMINVLGMPIKEDNVKGAEEAFVSSLRSGTCAMPVSVWSRLYRSLKPYLRPPGESGEGVLDFFHQQLSFAVIRRYLTSYMHDKSPYYFAVHSRLANYFKYVADPDGDLSWRRGHRRGISEAPYHQIEGRMFSALDTTLCDLGYIETKCSMGMTYDLVADYVSATMALEASQTKESIAASLLEFQRFVQARAHVLAMRPSQTFALACSLPESSSPCSKAMARWHSGREYRPWIRWTNKPQVKDPCIMTLAGHTMVVRKCEYCPIPGSDRIISCSDDNTIKIFDSRTGAELTTLRGHGSSVLCCSYSPDGKRIVSSSWTKELKVWSVETGSEVANLEGQKGHIGQCVFSPNGKFIASVSTDKTARIWDAETYAEVANLKGHAEGVTCCAFAPDSLSLLTGSSNGEIIKWTNNYNTWNEEQRFSGHSKGVNRIAVSGDGEKFASASDDRTIRIWDINGSTRSVLRTHKDGVVGVAFSHDSKRLVSASHDNTIVLWEVSTGNILAAYSGHTGSVFDCSFSMDDNFIITCSFDRTVKVWECGPYEPEDEQNRRGFRKPRASTTQEGHSARILGCSFSPAGDLIVTAGRDKNLVVWNGETGSVVRTLTGHKSNVFDCGWSPNGNRIVSASRDNTVKIWNAGTGDLVQTLTNHTGIVYGCAWSPDDKLVLTASEDKTIRLFETASFTQSAIMYGHRGPVRCCRFSPDGRRIVTGSEDTTIKLWETRRHCKVATFSGHTKAVTCVAFSPDSRKVISGGDDKTLIEWNATNAKKIAQWTKHKAPITGVAYSTDGKYIVSGSTDNTVIVWDAETKEEVCVYTCLSRITAMDCGPRLGFAVGDGAGAFYIFKPVGLVAKEETDNKKKNKAK